MMENTRSFYPTCFMLLKKRERRNKRATTDSPCIVLTVGGLKTEKTREDEKRLSDHLNEALQRGRLAAFVVFTQIS